MDTLAIGSLVNVKVKESEPSGSAISSETRREPGSRPRAHILGETGKKRKIPDQRFGDKRPPPALTIRQIGLHQFIQGRLGGDAANAKRIYQLFFRNGHGYK